MLSSIQPSEAARRLRRWRGVTCLYQATEVEAEESIMLEERRVLFFTGLLLDASDVCRLASGVGFNITAGKADRSLADSTRSTLEKTS